MHAKKLEGACSIFNSLHQESMHRSPTPVTDVSRSASCLLLFDEPRKNRAQLRDKRRAPSRREIEKMSLRWIHENLEAPTCDEECSDIDDSCSDDSCDTELFLQEADVVKNEKDIARDSRKKRETRRAPTSTVTFDGNGTPRNIERNCKSRKYPPYVIWDPRQPAKNPIYNCRIIKLYCRTGYHLAITPSGRVEGLSGNKEPYDLLYASPVSFGVIRIQSIETRLYLAFNKKGRLYGEINMTNENTEWEQWSIGSHDAFRSRKYVQYGWWIGIKKNGRVKLGSKTFWGQKAIQFSAIQED
ncbi:FGF1 factor, partial [Acromyrmex charruanus]